MAGTLLSYDDLAQLLRGRVLYRLEDGSPAVPPSGDKFDGRYAIEVAVNASELHGIRQRFRFETGEVTTKDE